MPHRFVSIGTDILETEQTDVVFAMGSRAQEILQACKVIPKNRTIASMRFPTCLTFQGGAQGLLSYSAAMIERDYEKYVACFLDLGLCIRREQTGSFEPQIGEYRYVDDFSDAVAYIEAESNKRPVAVSLDTETLGLDPWDKRKRLVSIQVSYTEGKTDVVYFDNQEQERHKLWDSPLRSQLEYLLTNPKVKMYGANFKYDQLWLWCRGKFECTNFAMDTYLVGSLLDEDRGNSLDLHTRWYVPELGGYDAHLNKTYDKNRMDLVPKTEFLQYAGGDPDACRRVSAEMRDEIGEDHALMNFYINVLHPASQAYVSVERTGMLVDVPYYMEMENELETEIDRLEDEGLKLIPGRIKRKYMDDLKLSRPALLRDFMFGQMGLRLKPIMLTEKKQEPATAIDHLLMFGDRPEAKAFVDVLREWNSARKILSTYVCSRDKNNEVKGGFLSHLRDDMRFHPNYFLFNGDEEEGGTNTGRTSARDPAIQTLVKRGKWAKKLRRAYIAPPGHKIVGLDYQQGELKIVACLAEEPTMIEAYQQGIDLHAITAAALAGWDWDDFMKLKEVDPQQFEDIRYLGKAGNFGLIYGMMPPGFQNYAQWNYGVTMTLDEATKGREAFFVKYGRLSPWHGETRSKARLRSMVRSPLGRVRHLPMIRSIDHEARSKAERQSLNAPVQATLSDMLLWAISIMHERGWFDEAPCIGSIHDQGLWYVPEDNWEMHVQQMKEVCENLPFDKVGWSPQLKFTTDCEMGSNLGEMKKVKL